MYVKKTFVSILITLSCPLLYSSEQNKHDHISTLPEEKRQQIQSHLTQEEAHLTKGVVAFYRRIARALSTINHTFTNSLTSTLTTANACVLKEALQKFIPRDLDPLQKQYLMQALVALFLSKDGLTDGEREALPEIDISTDTANFQSRMAKIFSTKHSNTREETALFAASCSRSYIETVTSLVTIYSSLFPASFDKTHWSNLAAELLKKITIDTYRDMLTDHIESVCRAQHDSNYESYDTLVERFMLLLHYYNGDKIPLVEHLEAVARASCYHGVLVPIFDGDYALLESSLSLLDESPETSMVKGIGLFCACLTENTDMVELFLRHNPNHDLFDDALHKVIELNIFPVFCKLLAHPLYLTQRNSNQENPFLFTCARYKRVKMTEIVLALDASIMGFSEFDKFFIVHCLLGAHTAFDEMLFSQFEEGYNDRLSPKAFYIGCLIHILLDHSIETFEIFWSYNCFSRSMITSLIEFAQQMRKPHFEPFLEKVLQSFQE